MPYSQELEEWIFYNYAQEQSMQLNCDDINIIELNDTSSINN